MINVYGDACFSRQTGRMLNGILGECGSLKFNVVTDTSLLIHDFLV